MTFKMNELLWLAAAAAVLLCSISDGAGNVGSWSQVVENSKAQKTGGQRDATPGTRRGSPWSPDPDELLGPYEDEAPPRDTEAYFLTPNNTAVTVQVGSTAALRCQVFNVGEHETVSWIRHRDHHLITLGSTTHSSDDRFQVTYDQSTKDWTLHIHYTQPRDAGIYECQLNAHPPIGVLTKLNVIEAVATIAGGPEMYIQVGSSVHLQCSIERYTEPPTYVFWYQNNRMVNYDDRRQFSVLYDGGGLSELRLGSASASDSGNYSCVPSNAQAASIVIHVITGEAPAAMQSASSSNYYHHLDVALLSLALHALSRLGLPLRQARR